MEGQEEYRAASTARQVLQTRKYIYIINYVNRHCSKDGCMLLVNVQNVLRKGEPLDNY